MKKVYLVFFLSLVFIFMIGCSENSSTGTTSSSNKDNIITNGSYNGELTMNFSFGQRTGKYKGNVKDGLPDGYGEFTAENSEGSKWTYKGEWKNGHFEGKGETTWSDGTKEIGIYKDDKITPMSASDMNKMYTTPKDYENHFIELTGKIFAQPEYFDGGIAVQMYTDIDNYDKNTIVYLYGTNIEVKKDDMIKVSGIVGEAFEGQNAFGAIIIAPTVHSRAFEIVTYEQLHPVIAKCTTELKQTQLGYSITIQKVELTSEETRVYVRVDNEGTANFNLYSFNGKIIQDGKQYEEQTNWDADYPKVQTDLVPGVWTEGIIAYPPVKNQSFKLILEGRSDNYSEDFEDFIYEISFEE